MKHLVFIVNPRSGVERQKQIQEAIDKHLDKLRYTWQILHTTRARHGVELARQAALAGAHAVVAVGGDGSVNDVVNGLAGTGVALAIIPKGSGNGIARTLGIPRNVEEAVQIINQGNIQTIDVAQANGRRFMGNAGVGFDALISQKFADSARRGLLVYAWLVTRHLWLYKTRNWEITVDGQKLKEHAFMVNVANCQQFGYNFKIAPMADYKDGLLDVVIIRRFPKILGALISYRALTGAIAGSRYVRHLTGSHITITHPALELMQADGDAHACAPHLEINILKAAQQVIMPEA